MTSGSLSRDGVSRWLFNHAFGPTVFPEAWSFKRPVLGLLYIPTMAALGDVPLRWQVFGLITRMLSSVGVWWGLRQLWPDRDREVAWVALLFAVYPGFQQQSISVV
jgi:carbon starvation protein CstA